MVQFWCLILHSIRPSYCALHLEVYALFSFRFPLVRYWHFVLTGLTRSLSAIRRIPYVFLTTLIESRFLFFPEFFLAIHSFCVLRQFRWGWCGLKEVSRNRWAPTSTPVCLHTSFTLLDSIRNWSAVNVVTALYVCACRSCESPLFDLFRLRDRSRSWERSLICPEQLKVPLQI